jgi:hypothetical protein
VLQAVFKWLLEQLLKRLLERLLERLLGACDLLDDGSNPEVCICRSLTGYERA